MDQQTEQEQLHEQDRAYLEDLPVARNIPAVEMVAGRSVVVASFDAHNVGDPVTIAVYTEIELPRAINLTL